MKKLLMVMMCMLLLAGTVSAFNVKEVDDSNAKQYGDYKYGKVTIESRVWYDPFGWIFDKTLVTSEITDHTANCLFTCYTEGTTVLYEKGYSLFDSLEFTDKKLKKKTYSNYKIYIKEETTYTINSLLGYDAQNKSIENITIFSRDEWVLYEGKKLDPGVYKWRIEAVKNPQESIDWIPTIAGEKIEEWAWWDALGGEYANFSATGSHSWSVPAGVTNISVLVLGGGGGGGSGGGNDGAGGGGAGGLIFNSTVDVSGDSSLDIWVGAGGIGQAGNGNGANGTNSNITINSYTIEAVGGGGGGGSGGVPGYHGGSGGGGYGDSSATTGGTSTSYGNDGGDGGPGSAGSRGGGGGGGAGGAGANGEAEGSGVGGDGGSGSVYYGETFACGGGGGGTTKGDKGCTHAGDGGSGSDATSAVDNYGSGGGGSGTSATAGGDGGSGLVFIRYVAPANGPNVTTNWPTNGQQFIISNINSNATVWDDSGNFNVSLLINGTINQTNTSSFNNTLYNFNVALSDGTYGLVINATDNESNSASGTTRIISIDTVNPTININNPAGNISVNQTPYNVTINATITDLNLGTCWYSNDTYVTNTTFTCNSNVTTTLISPAWYTLYVCANDTFAHETCTSATYYANLINWTVEYDSPVVEGDNEDFTFNLTATSISSLDHVILTWNATNYSSTGSHNGTFGTYNANLDIPGLNSPETVQLNFWYELDNINYSTTVYNQSLSILTPLNVTNLDCSDKALTFTMQEETNLTNVTGNVAYNFQYGTTYNNTFKRTFGEIDNITSFHVCINATAVSEYTLGYGEIQYSGDNYADRRYYLFTNLTLSNTTVEQHYLRNILSSQQTTFELTFEDTDLNVYQEKYTALWRWYPELDDYQIVGMGKTDSDGQTVGHVISEDVDYRVGLYHINGSLINLDDPRRFICASSPCSLTIRVDQAEVDLTAFFDVESSLTYNSTTKVFTYIYNDPNQYTDSMRLVVERLAGTNVLTICDSTSSGYTGVIACNVSAYTGTFKATAYRTASPEVPIAQKLIQTVETVFKSSFGLFISAILWLIVVLSGFGGSPVVTIIFAVIALIPALIFGSINLAIFTGVAVLGAIVIHFIKMGRGQ